MSKKATIEVRSRDIKGAGIFGAQHLFIIFSDVQGISHVIRGEPEQDNMLIDDIKITLSLYSKVHIDYAEGNPSSLIFEGSDVEMQRYMNQIWSRAEEINAGKYDYKLPIPGCSPNLCHVQNSNTAVKVMIEATDLRLVLPVVDGKEIWAPGIEGEFKHSIIDEGIKTMNKAFDIWGSFSSEDIRNPEIDNGRRFELLAQKAKNAGDSSLAEVYANLAVQQELFMSVFGEVEKNDQDHI